MFFLCSDSVVSMSCCVVCEFSVKFSVCVNWAGHQHSYVTHVGLAPGQPLLTKAALHWNSLLVIG